MSMGPVKDAEGTILSAGDSVELVEDVFFVQEGFEIKNKIPVGSKFRITGFPADDRYIQVNYGDSEWAITSDKVKKI